MRTPLTRTGLVETSFLRRVDARTKLALALAVSTAAILPLAPLAIVAAGFVLLIATAGVLPHALAQWRRSAVLLCVLFAVDWLFIGLGFAVLITVRLMLFTGAFSLLVATTTADEVRVALERLRVPRRFAFTFATAFRAITHFEDEWRGILEAQHARGLMWEVPDPPGVHTPLVQRWQRRLGRAVGLVVPAIVLAAQRAWAAHEASAARGLGAPQARVARSAPMSALDVLLLGAAGALLVAARVVGW
jgi:energy-coupling factor transporter transmembrane protein EcfT